MRIYLQSSLIWTHSRFFASNECPDFVNKIREIPGEVTICVHSLYEAVAIFIRFLACFNLKQILGNSLYSSFGIYQNLTVGNLGRNWYLFYV